MQTKPKSPKKASASEAGVVSGGSNPSGVIYVDQDSDITSIVTKLRGEQAKNVKIVVPKNSAALKSGVNLKLLARTAHSKSKNLSLITSDSKLVSMAGAAKIATAPNLSAEPNLKVSAAAGAATAAAALKINNPEEDSNEDEEELDASQPQPEEDLDEDLTIDDAELAAGAGATSDLEPDAKSKKAKAEKGKKVPNFYDFRKKALIGLGAFLGVLVLVLLLMTTRKSAIINVKANAERVDVNFSAKLNESATETTKDELKAVKKSGSKSTTETTPATGEQDIGAKAGGKVTITNCTNSPVTLSAGTGVSSGGLTYLTNNAVTIPASNGVIGTGECVKNGKKDVNVTAQNAGSQYNAGPRAYTISGVSSSISGQGGEMSGGTTQVVKVVSQSDVNTLKEKMATNNQEAYKAELQSQFNSSQEPLEETFVVQLADVQVTPAVGQQADSVTGTVVANYSMYGAEKSELEKILELNINEVKKDESQSIVKNGLDELKVISAENGEYTFTTVAYIGPNIDTEKIKQETAGKKKGEAIQIVEGMEGVDDASVKLTPFWASTLPKADKIQVKIEIADGSKDQ